MKFAICYFFSRSSYDGHFVALSTAYFRLGQSVRQYCRFLLFRVPARVLHVVYSNYIEDKEITNDFRRCNFVSFASGYK